MLHGDQSVESKAEEIGSIALVNDGMACSCHAGNTACYNEKTNAVDQMQGLAVFETPTGVYCLAYDFPVPAASFHYRSLLLTDLAFLKKATSHAQAQRLERGKPTTREGNWTGEHRDHQDRGCYCVAVCGSAAASTSCLDAAGFQGRVL